MNDFRHPAQDSLPPSDPTWVDIEFGPGQVPGRTQPGDLQWSPDLDSYTLQDFRRTPDVGDFKPVVHRPPFWPA